MKNLLYQNLKCKFNIDDFDQIIEKIEDLPESFFEQMLFLDKQSYLCEIIDLHDRIQFVYSAQVGQNYTFTFDPPINGYTIEDCIHQYYSNIIAFIKHMAFFFTPVECLNTITGQYSLN